MKRLYLLLLLIVFLLQGCSFKYNGDPLQIIGDQILIGIAKKPIKNLANHVIKHHPEDVNRYIRYCNMIISCTNKDQVESYINIGVNTLISENVSDPDLSQALIDLKTLIDIDVTTSSIDFDKGSYRIALKFIHIFADILSDGVL